MPDKDHEVLGALTVTEAFADCVKHHQMIMEFTGLLEDLFRWFLFPKLFYTGLENLNFYFPSNC